jgi:hypothetical protein
VAIKATIFATISVPFLVEAPLLLCEASLHPFGYDHGRMNVDHPDYEKRDRTKELHADITA